jgi:hypothetical protein
VVKQEDGTYTKDPNNRFRFVKNELGLIYDGGIVANNIANCEVRNSPNFQPPLTKRQVNKNIKRAELERIVNP